MKKSRLLGAVCASFLLFTSSISCAALVSRLGGDAYYDTVLGITWLGNANYAATELTDARVAEIVTNTPTFSDGHVLTSSDFTRTGVDTYTGAMTWWGAMAWVEQLNYAGFDGWRLGNMDVDGDGTRVRCRNPDITTEPMCRDNEYDYMYWYNHVNTASPSPFTNVEPVPGNNFPSLYWALNELPPSPASDVGSGTSYKFTYIIGVGSTGEGGTTFKDTNALAAWAVADGDVFVPIPPALWLFGSGLLGLVGMVTKKAG